jgi:hypothetical protein
MLALKHSLLRLILPSAAAVGIAGLVLTFGQPMVATAASAGPAWAVSTGAAVVPADDHTHRYYDRERKDYHQWNEQEERAYRNWMKEQHREYRDFGKLNRKNQKEYWHWRHEHPEVVR